MGFTCTDTATIYRIHFYRGTGLLYGVITDILLKQVVLAEI